MRSSAGACSSCRATIRGCADVLERDPTTDLASLETHRMRHVLTNVVGALDTLEFNVIERTLQANEVLLLCSDGFTDRSMTPQSARRFSKKRRSSGPQIA